MATRLEQISDPVRWVDAWPAPGLSVNIRNKIKAQLLRAPLSSPFVSPVTSSAAILWRRLATSAS